jgi:hypothetical protein
MNGIQRSMATPSRPRVVPSQLLLVVQPPGQTALVVPSRAVQAKSVSTPKTVWPDCQL